MRLTPAFPQLTTPLLGCHRQLVFTKQAAAPLPDVMGFNVVVHAKDRIGRRTFITARGLG
jgi:hypothetical protein